MVDRKAWDHQAKAIARAVPVGYHGLLMDPGVGKTFTAIQILRRWYEREGRVLRTLVFCPPIVIENWRREISEHSLVGSYCIPLVGTGVKRIETFGSRKALPTIFITNYESLNMPSLYALMQAWRPEVIIFDESHKLKDISSKRTKLANKLCKGTRHRLILTGTPSTNGIMDLFSQVLILDGGETFGKSLPIFRAQYFYDKNAAMPKERHFPDWVIRPGAVEDVNRKIARITSTARKEECLDLPPLVRKTITVELSKEQRKLYTDMERDFITYVKDKHCVADLAIVKAMRMQQIVAGFIPLSDDDETVQTVIKDNPRLEALKEILEEIVSSGHKTLVWSCFKQSYAAIRRVCESLKIRFVEVHGDVGAREKQLAVDSFQNDAGIKVLIGHPQSAGIGINLTAASYSIFYSRNFSLENDIQAEARNFRGGSERHEKITRIDLVARNTIDEPMLEALAGKKSVLDAIMKGVV